MHQSMFKQEKDEYGLYAATIYPAHMWVGRVIEYIRTLGYQEPKIQHLWKSTEPSLTWCGEDAKMRSPLTEPERMARPVCAKCHQQAMHWRADEQSKVEANLKAIDKEIQRLLTPRPISSYNQQAPINRMTNLETLEAIQTLRDRQKNE